MRSKSAKMDKYMKLCLYDNSALVRFLNDDNVGMSRESVLDGRKINGFECMACGLRFNSAKDIIEHRSEDFQPGTGRKCYEIQHLKDLKISFQL